MKNKGNCLGLVPYNSVFGFVFILVGGGVLCGTLHYGLYRVDSFFRHNFFPVYSLAHLRVAAVVLGTTIVAFGILVVIFSMLALSVTRGRIYRGDRFIMAGRMSAAMLLCITYAAIITWLVTLCMLVIPTFCWIMFNSICTMELAHVWHGPGARRPGPDSRVAPSIEELRARQPWGDTYTARLSYYYPNMILGQGQARPVPETIPTPIETGFMHPGLRPDNLYSHILKNTYNERMRLYGFGYVFNLTSYGIYLKPWLYDPSLNYREAITNLESFAGFCDEVSIVGPLFACSLVSAVFILVGLTLFVGSLSGFYSRLKLTKELTDFKQSIALRSPKAHNQSAYF